MKKTLIGLVLLSMTSIAGAREYKDGDRVSTMNGELVEVGERNKYHYDAPKANIDVNPFGIMTGVYSAGASYALTDIANIRGDISFDDNNSSLEFSIGSQIYFKKMYSGIFLEPGLLRREAGNVLGPQILLGYTWFWDSGMNVSLAAGGGRNLNYDGDDDFVIDEDDDAIASDQKTFGNGYLRVGYSF